MFTQAQVAQGFPIIDNSSLRIRRCVADSFVPEVPLVIIKPNGPLLYIMILYDDTPPISYLTRVRHSFIVLLVVVRGWARVLLSVQGDGLFDPCILRIRILIFTLLVLRVYYTSEYNTKAAVF